MRRAWIVRFAWLLCLASIGTAILPWAHDLSHRHGLPPLVTQAHAPAEGAAANEPASDAESDICIVCAHLCSHQLSLPCPLTVVVAAAQPPAALEPGSASDVSEPPAWQRPATRAPPHFSAL